MHGRGERASPDRTLETRQHSFSVLFCDQERERRPGVFFAVRQRITVPRWETSLTSRGENSSGTSTPLQISTEVAMSNSLSLNIESAWDREIQWDSSSKVILRYLQEGDWCTAGKWSTRRRINHILLYSTQFHLCQNHLLLPLEHSEKTVRKIFKKIPCRWGDRNFVGETPFDSHLGCLFLVIPENFYSISEHIKWEKTRQTDKKRQSRRHNNAFTLEATVIRIDWTNSWLSDFFIYRTSRFFSVFDNTLLLEWINSVCFRGEKLKWIQITFLTIQTFNSWKFRNRIRWPDWTTLPPITVTLVESFAFFSCVLPRLSSVLGLFPCVRRVVVLC